MDIKDYRYRVELLLKQRVEDSIGGYTTSYISLGERWCNIKELPINPEIDEYKDYRQQINITTRKVGIDPANAVVRYNNNDYTVVSVTSDLKETTIIALR